MPTDYVEFQELTVLKVRADMKGEGPSASFRVLESKLPSLKGRKFYGTFRMTLEGPEYFACVVRQDSDDPVKMGLDPGEIPGGWYARRKLADWRAHVTEIQGIFLDMLRVEQVAPSRPSVEFYRSQTEVQLLLPVLARTGVT